MRKFTNILHHVIQSTYEICNPPARNPPWPVRKERLADAAFVCRAFASPQRAGRMEEIGIGSAQSFPGWAIVASKDDKRAVDQAKLFEFVDDRAHGRVHMRNHGGV